MHELPLVFFTVLAQTSAGIFLISILNYFIYPDPNKEDILFKATIVSFLIMMAASISALFHLGQPLRIFNVIFGVGRSPMSNEVLSCGVYAGLLFASATFFYLKKYNIAILFAVLVAIAAVLMLLLIPNLYNIQTIPQWATIYTNIQMIVTAFIAGSIISMIWQITSINIIAMIFSMIVSLLIIPGYMAFLGDTVPNILSKNIIFWNIKIIFYGLTAILIVLAWYKNNSIQIKNNSLQLFLGASIAIVVAELAGRVAFYNLWSINM